MTNFDVPSLVIDPDTMQEANEATSWLLAVPDTARKGGKATFWSELFDVTASTYGISEKDPERLEIKLSFRVAAESPELKNVGKAFTSRYLINPGQMKVKNSKERTMSLMSLGRLGNFLRASGLIDEASSANGLDLKEFFYGENPPVVGAKVYATIKHYKDKDGVQRQDISQFDDLTAGETA
jgi:hypothetical protein